MNRRQDSTLHFPPFWFELMHASDIQRRLVLWLAKWLLVVQANTQRAHYLGRSLRRLRVLWWTINIPTFN